MPYMIHLQCILNTKEKFLEEINVSKSINFVLCLKLDEMMTKLEDLANKEKISEEDIQIDNSTLFMYCVENFFHSKFNSQNAFITFSNYKQKIYFPNDLLNGKKNFKKKFEHKDPQVIINEEEKLCKAVKLKQAYWLDNVTEFAVTNSEINEQNFFLKDYFDTNISMWIKSLVNPKIDEIENRINIKAKDFKKNHPNQTNEDIFFEFYKGKFNYFLILFYKF